MVQDVYGGGKVSVKCMNNDVNTMLNDAIIAFSSSMGNDYNELVKFCSLNNITEINLYKRKIRKIQNDVFKMVCNYGKKLTSDEIKHNLEKYLSEHNYEFNEMAKNNLMDYLVWMSWHEGYLK